MAEWAIIVALIVDSDHEKVSDLAERIKKDIELRIENVKRVEIDTVEELA